MARILAACLLSSSSEACVGAPPAAPSAEDGTGSTGAAESSSSGPVTTMPPPDTTSGGGGSSSSGFDEDDDEGTSSGPAPGTSEGGESSSGEPPDLPYPACNLAATPPCPEPYDRCYDSAPGYTACGITCVDDSECPAPLTGDAVATCAGPQNDICVLDCAGGVVCPDGMECVDVVGGAFHRCVWPDPV
ncbi:MAG: hypothetical protein H6712_28985 [Myxococcales bacterium]|nr:hypothetical protein [Myxococcales bacterium]